MCPAFFRADDNEMGYSNRLVDLALYVAAQDKAAGV